MNWQLSKSGIRWQISNGHFASSVERAVVLRRNFAFQAPRSLVSAVNRTAARTYREKNNNNNNKAESFFRLDFNVYINVDNREKVRARNKTTTTKTNLVGRKTRKFYSGAEKIRNTSFHQGENERQWKTKVNRNTDISSIKRVTREFLEVSRFRTFKWRWGTPGSWGNPLRWGSPVYQTR